MKNLFIFLASVCLAIHGSKAGTSDNLEEKCEIYVWTTGNNYAIEYRVGPSYLLTGPAGEMTSTIGFRVKAVLDAQGQIEIFQDSNIFASFDSSQYLIKYGGEMTRNEFEYNKKKKRRAYDSNSKCYIDFIVFNNGYEESAFGSRKLYTIVYLNVFEDRKMRVRGKRMVDGMSGIGDAFLSGDIARVDREIAKSFLQNVGEFLSESKDWLRKR